MRQCSASIIRCVDCLLGEVRPANKDTATGNGLDMLERTAGVLTEFYGEGTLSYQQTRLSLWSFLLLLHSRILSLRLFFQRIVYSSYLDATFHIILL